MKYTRLRAYMKSKNLQKDYVLHDCGLIIDGKTYFRDTYKKSGCQFILGGEYDRYAKYLRNTLNAFIKSNVKVYVIFNGATEADLDRRKEIQQKVINNADNITPGQDNVYCEPIFVKDVNKEVLEELGIRYFVTEYDNIESLLNVAKIFKFPLLTKNIEYSLYGVSCITPKSISVNEETNSISCSIYSQDMCRRAFSMAYCMKPIFLTLVDEDGPQFEKLADIVIHRKHRYNILTLISLVLRWIRRQNQQEAMDSIIKNLADEYERAEFLKIKDINVSLCSTKWTIAVNYFKEKDPFHGLSGKDWFMRGVGVGRIATAYINLKHKSIFSGSWVIVDKNREDPMLSALDIVLYVYGLLEKPQNDKITFFGRSLGKSSIAEIGTNLKEPSIKEKENVKPNILLAGKNDDLFQNFLSEYLPGFQFHLLDCIPKECWMLVIVLVYFCKRNQNFIFFAYSILLSYVMLGPVSRKVGIIRRSNFLLQHHLDEENDVDSQGLGCRDCTVAATELMDLFYIRNCKKIFNRTILHSLAEFQHCLQHMNYLNKLCNGKIQCTVYQQTINLTFICNVYRKIKNKDRPMKYFESRLGRSPVWEYYKMIESTFVGCLASVQ